jgi:hypothetical protein
LLGENRWLESRNESVASILISQAHVKADAGLWVCGFFCRGGNFNPDAARMGTRKISGTPMPHGSRGASSGAGQGDLQSGVAAEIDHDY